MYFHGDRKQNKIALTFDDGPSEVTPAVLDILKKYSIKATFFIVGKMIDGREVILERAKNEGHEFGNHTFSHRRLWFMSKNKIETEIMKCDEALGRVGITSPLIRFPGLKFGLNALTVCKKLNKKIIFADLISINQFAYDWFMPWLKKIGFIKNVNPTDVIRLTIKNTKNGSILGFHDYLQEIGYNGDLPLILDQIIPTLQQKGFDFVTVTNLIEI